MVRVSVKTNINAERRKLEIKTQPEPYLNLKNVRKEFNLYLKNRLNALKCVDEDISRSNETITKAILESALEIGGPASKENAKKIKEKTKKLIEKRREMKRNENRNVGYAEICKTITMRITEDIGKLNCKLIKSTIEIIKV